MENLTTPTPPGGLTSAEQALESIEKMRNAADRILVNHVPKAGSSRMPTSPLRPSVQANL
jgi:hypothetical protein